jgi:hypothetical protein
MKQVDYIVEPQPARLLFPRYAEHSCTAMWSSCAYDCMNDYRHDCYSWKLGLQSHADTHTFGYGEPISIRSFHPFLKWMKNYCEPSAP